MSCRMSCILASFACSWVTLALLVPAGALSWAQSKEADAIAYIARNKARDKFLVIGVSRYKTIDCVTTLADESGSLHWQNCQSQRRIRFLWQPDQVEIYLACFFVDHGLEYRTPTEATCVTGPSGW